MDLQTMVAEISSIHESNDQGQTLLNEVVRLFTDLLIASGATIPMIKSAMALSAESAVENLASPRFTDLGSMQRDCMEVMCTWRRDANFVDPEGEPKPLSISSGQHSFEELCRKASCQHASADLLEVLLEFGAVTQDSSGLVRSTTPTFLLGRTTSGGLIATDGLIKQLEGFLRCVHHNVRSVSGHGKPRFERACTVTVAIELEPIFDRLVRTRGQEFIDSIDEWLERNTKLESPSGRYLELGAGAYLVNLGERPGRKRKGWFAKPLK